MRQAYITLASGYSEENYNQRFETKIVERFSGETFKYKEETLNNYL